MKNHSQATLDYGNDEVTNYLITAPIFQARSEEIGEALIET